MAREPIWLAADGQNRVFGLLRCNHGTGHHSQLSDISGRRLPNAPAIQLVRVTPGVVGGCWHAAQKSVLQRRQRQQRCCSRCRMDHRWLQRRLVIGLDLLDCRTPLQQCECSWISPHTVAFRRQIVTFWAQLRSGL